MIFSHWYWHLREGMEYGMTAGRNLNELNEWVMEGGDGGREMEELRQTEETRH